MENRFDDLCALRSKFSGVKVLFLLFQSGRFITNILDFFASRRMYFCSSDKVRKCDDGVFFSNLIMQ